MHRGLALGILGAVLQLTAASECSAEESPLPNAITASRRSGSWGASAAGTIWRSSPAARGFSSAGAIAWMWSKPPAAAYRYRCQYAGACMAFAFAPELKRGYTGNGRANTVTAFETGHAPGDPGVAGWPGKEAGRDLVRTARATPVRRRWRQQTTSACSIRPTLQVLTSIALPGPPEFMVTDAAGTVFVNIETEAASWLPSTQNRSRSSDLAVCRAAPILRDSHWTAANHRLFSVCEGQVMDRNRLATASRFPAWPFGLEAALPAAFLTANSASFSSKASMDPDR